MGTQIRGHVSRKGPIIEEMSDRMDAAKKRPPQVLDTPNEGLATPDKEVTAMENRSRSNRQAIALEYLSISAREFETAIRSRIRYILLAREYGVTNAKIGQTLGISESAVRGLIARHGDADG